MTSNLNVEKKKIKVLFIITKGNFGGAQRYVFDLATSLPKDTFETTVALGEGETLEKKLREKNIKVRKVETMGRNISLGRDFVSFFEIVRILKEEKPDIAHLNSSKAGGLGALAVRILNLGNKEKIHTVFTGHGWAFNEDRNLLSKIFISLLHWATILLSHKTIAVSERIKEQIKLFPFTKGKIVQIYNGIESPIFLNRNDAREKLLPNHGNNIWIGTVAELHKNKGLDYAIEGFSHIAEEFRNSIFVVIGEGEERKKLEKQIGDPNLEERVFLVGFKENAASLLKAFDIATFTSRTEAFPYVPLEMGLAELPIIANWVGGIPEIILNGESGILVQKGDIDSIEKNLSELIKDENERKRLGINLRERVEENFNLRKMLDKTINLYEEFERV